MKILEAQVQISAMDRTAAAFDSVAARASQLDKSLRGTGGVPAAGSAPSGSAPAPAKGERMDTAPLVGAGAAITAFGLKAEQAFAAFDRRLSQLGDAAETNPQQLENMRGRARMLSDRYGVPIESTVDAMEVLAQQGKHYDEIMGEIEPIMRAATVSGASSSDIAKTASALTDQFKIPIADLPKAFDILYAGGLAGRFELKDMATELPKLAGLAAPRGLEGLSGVSKLVSYLETIAAAAPDNSSAADWMLNIFQKMDSDKTKKNFSDDSISGVIVNLAGALEAAKKGGNDQVAVLLSSLKEITQGDDSRINQIFQDLQALLGATYLQRGEAQIASFNKQLVGSAGMVDKNLPKYMDDAYANNQRLLNVWQTAQVDVGSQMWVMFKAFRDWANGNGKDLSGRHDMTDAQKAYVYQSRDIAEMQQQQADWQARATERRGQAGSAGFLGRGIFEDQARNADDRATAIAQEIINALARRAKLGPDAVSEDPWKESPLNKRGAAGQLAPIDVTGKVVIDPASKADVRVTVKVDGPGHVSGMAATAGGILRANVGISMPPPGHISRRDE